MAIFRAWRRLAVWRRQAGTPGPSNTGFLPVAAGRATIASVAYGLVVHVDRVCRSRCGRGRRRRRRGDGDGLIRYRAATRRAGRDYACGDACGDALRRAHRPRCSCGSRRSWVTDRALAGTTLCLLPVAAYALVNVTAGLDWNFVIQKLGVVVAWLVAFAAVHATLRQTRSKPAGLSVRRSAVHRPRALPGRRPSAPGAPRRSLRGGRHVVPLHPRSARRAQPRHSGLLRLARGEHARAAVAGDAARHPACQDTPAGRAAAAHFFSS